MSHKIFFIGDTHFGHANILTFTRSDGTPLREFAHVDEMDEHIITQWNSVVRPVDKVYHLGDVAINQKYLHLCGRLNGHKRLVRGNHDIYNTKKYVEYFEEIIGVRVFHDLPCGVVAASHIPIHPDSLNRWTANIHGHLHSNTLPDPRYINLSCEQINYTPVDMDWVIAEVERRGLENPRNRKGGVKKYVD